MTVQFIEAREFPVTVPVVIVGAGACGLTAALAARDAGAEVLVLERDKFPSGSTALSSGFIPASFTRFQAALGVRDSPQQFAADILRKNRGGADPARVAAICGESGRTIEWLAVRHAIPFVVVQGFLYPGHSALRMHAVPEKTGKALMAALERAAVAAGADILCEARVKTVFADRARRVLGVAFERRDGSTEAVGCAALVLACCGFGGNAAMVRQYLPEIAAAGYFGHAGNQGDALAWGTALGAALRHMGAYQGHGSVAAPHGILITWALMMEGGIQVNARGERFSNEHEGYSEQSVRVMAQPDNIAWDLFDERLHRLAMEFDDYRQAESAGAVKTAPDAAALAAITGLPRAALAGTLAEVERCADGSAVDPFGRDFTTQPKLSPPYFAVRVTGALFHTQGGLAVDEHAQVCDAAGQPLPNLFAGGGAAAGVSGNDVAGYLSGNGLLTAVVLGRLAGAGAARRAAGG